MARNGTKTGGRSFKKGQVANPGGFTKEQAEARRLTREGLKDLLNKLRLCTHAEMEDLLDNPNAPALERMLVKCYRVIEETGDIRQMDVLLDRLVGKVKDEVDVTVKPFIIQRKDGSRVEMGTKRKDE